MHRCLQIGLMHLHSSGGQAREDVMASLYRLDGLGLDIHCPLLHFFTGSSIDRLLIRVCFHVVAALGIQFCNFQFESRLTKM